MENQANKANKDGNIWKLTLPSGLQIGIMNLDVILDEVAGLGLIEPETIKVELLARVKACNFVSARAENEYASALLEEYQNKYSNVGQVKQKIQKKPHAG